ncbi:MAG: hypothetical protein LQ342_001226 [Letrouitia transgressa]|nr:MAG: hypothetical protein LQ342_001226 [Letrouitia transgressa]
MSRILIENGADLNNRNVDGETPLHTTFSPSMEQILKNYDRLIDYSTLDSGGQTLLHHLACSNQTTGEIFEFINRRGNYAFTNLDGQGRSVLHLAASRGNVDVVHYILTQRSVDVNAQDGSGQTSLHHAVRSRRAPSTIELLISNGADHRIQDKTGRTALHSAALLGKEAAVKTLVNVIGANALYVEDHPTEIPMRIGKRNQVASVQNCLDGMIIGRESECHLSNQKVYCSFATPRLRTVTQDLPKGMQEESELIPYSWVYLSWCQARSSWRREEKTLRQLVKAVMFVLVLWAIWHLFA